MLSIGLMVTILPHRAGAFWFFSNVSANAGINIPLVHDSRMVLLRAATNTNPNPIGTHSPVIITSGSALIAQSGPEGTVADINPSAGNGQISLYVVREGDSLSEIAQMFGVSINTILWANNIKNAGLIKPGDTLLILPVSGLRHTVKKGETIASIAKEYHANAGDIALYNGLDDGKKLKYGATIILPGGEMPVRVTRYARSIRIGARVARYRRIRKAPLNPYRGGGGPAIPGFFTDPLPGEIVTQGLHGWNAFDIGARSGTPIHAAASGRVIVSRVGGWNGGYGNYVVIDHGNGTQSLYAHMSRDVSSVGEFVARGHIIGYVGETGEATGPHLHFEVRGAENPFARCREGEIDTRCFLR